MEKEFKLTDEQKKTLEEVKLKNNIDCSNYSNCYDCYDCSYCSDCSDCSYCFDKKYMIRNVQFTKEQYKAFLKGDLK